MTIFRRTAVLTSLAGAVLSLGLAAAPAAAAATPGPRVTDAAGDARTQDRFLRPGANQPQADLLLYGVDLTSSALSFTLTAGAIDSSGATTYGSYAQLQTAPQGLYFAVLAQGGTARVTIYTGDGVPEDTESGTPAVPPTIDVALTLTPVYDAAARTVRVDVPRAAVDAAVTELRGTPISGDDRAFLSAVSELRIPARLLQPAETVRDAAVQSGLTGLRLGG